MNENQVGVILEEVRDMFKTLAEGQRVIENRLGKVEEGQKLLESDMKKVKSDLQIIKSFVIAADNSFNYYESRIKALEKKTANL